MVFDNRDWNFECNRRRQTLWLEIGLAPCWRSHQPRPDAQSQCPARYSTPSSISRPLNSFRHKRIVVCGHIYLKLSL